MDAVRERAIVSLRSKPSLPSHVRLHFDRVRQAWAVLSPEKVFWPNEISLDILRRCDGQADLSAIVAELAADYGAEEEEIAADVAAFLQEWADNLLVKL